MELWRSNCSKGGLNGTRISCEAHSNSIRSTLRIRIIICEREGWAKENKRGIAWASKSGRNYSNYKGLESWNDEANLPASILWEDGKLPSIKEVETGNGSLYAKKSLRFILIFSQLRYRSLKNKSQGINLNIQTLTIHGKEDSLITLTMITKTAEILGKFEVWENGGHMLPVEDTPRYLKSIIEFIK